MVVLTRLTIEIGGFLQVHLDAATCLVRLRPSEAPVDIPTFTRLLEHRGGDGVVPGDPGSSGVEAAKPQAAMRHIGSACSLEERGGASEVLPNAFPRRVEAAEVSASSSIPTVARTLKERRGLHNVSAHAGAFLIENAEARAAIHGAAIASLLQECTGASGVSLHPASPLIDDAETGASGADAALARFLEQLGGAGVILENVFALLELHGELIAGSGVPRSAGVAELSRFGVPRVAAGEHDGGHSHEEWERVRAWYHVRRGLRVSVNCGSGRCTRGAVGPRVGYARGPAEVSPGV
jgi:hypothetical protein